MGLSKAWSWWFVYRQTFQNAAEKNRVWRGNSFEGSGSHKLGHQFLTPGNFSQPNPPHLDNPPSVQLHRHYYYFTFFSFFFSKHQNDKSFTMTTAHRYDFFILLFFLGSGGIENGE